MFRVWAPDAKTMHLSLGASPETQGALAMTKLADGYFTALALGATTGTHYFFHVDGRGPFPDPASRYQPEGVHGPSVVIDPRQLPVARCRMDRHSAARRGFL